MRLRRKERRAQRRRAKVDAALRAKSQKLRARLPVREKHEARMKHEHKMRAYASSGRMFPYQWAWN